MIGDLEGPGAWDEHRLRAAVPAHRDQPPIYGGDHAAPGDAADLLRLHQHPVANLDHRRLLWMVTKPGHSKCPQDRRLHSIRAAVAIALALPVVLQVSRIADGILLLWALVDPSSTERIRSRRPGRPALDPLPVSIALHEVLREGAGDAVGLHRVGRWVQLEG